MSRVSNIAITGATDRLVHRMALALASQGHTCPTREQLRILSDKLLAGSV